ARMAPQQTSFCLPLDDKKASISIPLLFNNTRPHSVSYSVTDPVTGHKNVFDLSERDILAKNAAPVTRPEDTDDWGLPAK
ncbi:hypothetical protein, partial [Vibrio cholerae]|uniref:hypothetical protein n=1 Tax=Vibrio cholerae TaxID=666 RepID=UPI001F3C6287